MKVAMVVAGMVLVGAMGMGADAGILDVKVTTDGSVDCSSFQSVARDLFRDCKTDEAKAIAAWYFVRRTHFHWPKIPNVSSLDLMNSFGFGLCYHQSQAFAQLCVAGGLRARRLHLRGHVIAEAYYDKAWHLFDCQVGWFAYRKDKSGVAGCAEMKKDPTIVSLAAKEGRGSKPFFQCRDNPGAGADYARTAKPRGEAKAPKRRLMISLRRGESITRTWANEGKGWFPGGEKKWTLPRHTCTRQTIDANDPVNWPFWKTYAQIRRKDGDKVVYGAKRYFGNGRLVYAPDLTGEGFKDGVVKDGLKNVSAGAGGLRPAEAGKVASVTFEVVSPYYMVDAWLDLAAFRKTDGDVLAVKVKGRKARWRTVWSADKTGDVTAKGISLKAEAWFSKRYLVRVELKAAGDAANARVGGLTVTSVFMNNLYTLPHFVPGRNVVRVTAAAGADLAANPLTLVYVWEEAGKERTLRRHVKALPFECVVNVAGKELPKMKSVTLSVKK
jgi:hypothetical protein